MNRNRHKIVKAARTRMEQLLKRAQAAEAEVERLEEKVASKLEPLWEMHAAIGELAEAGYEFWINSHDHNEEGPWKVEVHQPGGEVELYGGKHLAAVLIDVANNEGHCSIMEIDHD